MKSERNVEKKIDKLLRTGGSLTLVAVKKILGEISELFYFINLDK